MKKLVVLILAAGVFAVPAAAAAAACEQVTGEFVADVVPCPGPFCTAGTLTGLTFEGASTITVAGGTLTGSDHGHIDYVTGGFVTVVGIAGGTGAYTDAFGVIVATGDLTPTGTAGTYRGVVCTP